MYLYLLIRKISRCCHIPNEFQWLRFVECVILSVLKFGTSLISLSFPDPQSFLTRFRKDEVGHTQGSDFLEALAENSEIVKYLQFTLWFCLCTLKQFVIFPQYCYSIYRISSNS